MAAAYTDVGLDRFDTFYPRCPTVDVAHADAARIRDDRRSALTKIAGAMRKWGTEDDAAELAEIEAELEQLGGADQEEQAEVDAMLENAVTPEFECLRRGPSGLSDKVRADPH